MCSYNVFVKTGHENKALDEIRRVWHVNGIRPFIPIYDNVLNKLCNSDHCIEFSKGYQKSGAITIGKGPMAGYESVVKKVNRLKIGLKWKYDICALKKNRVY